MFSVGRSPFMRGGSRKSEDGGRCSPLAVHRLRKTEDGVHRWPFTVYGRRRTEDGRRSSPLAVHRLRKTEDVSSPLAVHRLRKTEDVSSPLAVHRLRKTEDAVHRSPFTEDGERKTNNSARRTGHDPPRTSPNGLRPLACSPGAVGRRYEPTGATSTDSRSCVIYHHASVDSVAWWQKVGLSPFPQVSTGFVHRPMSRSIYELFSRGPKPKRTSGRKVNSIIW